MIHRDKRSFKQQYLDYWDELHSLYLLYKHQLVYRWAIDKGVDSTLILPKLKRHRLYPKEYKYYRKVPKAYRNRYSTRPFRALTRAYLIQVLLAYQSGTLDGLAEPILKNDHWCYF